MEGASGGGIKEEASGRRHHGGGIVGKASWQRHHGGGVMEEGCIMEEASWRHLGDIWGASGGIWEALRRRHLGRGFWKHLGDIWEASTLGFPPLSKRCLLETQRPPYHHHQNPIRLKVYIWVFVCFFLAVSR